MGNAASFSSGKRPKKNTGGLLDRIHPLWAFNLDGGPSTALLVRPEPKGLLKTVYGNIVKSTDIIGFCE